jgi:hypothetical protein
MEPLMTSIRQTLNKLTALPSAARAVLIEVCELFEIKGKCFASNEYLGERVCCHKRSVSRHLVGLQKLGLLAIEVEGRDNSRRLITPSPEVIQSYRSGEADALASKVAESTPDVKRVYTACVDPSTPGVMGSTPGVNHTIVTLEKTLEENNLLHGELATLRAAVMEAEARLKKAAEQYRADQQTITALKAENQKLTEKLVARPPKVDAVALASEDLAFEVFWDAYDKKVGSKPNTQRLWQKLAAGPRRAILNGLKVYRAGVSDKQFLPYPETFLNGRVWEAEDYGRVLQVQRTANETPTNIAAGVITGGTIPSMRSMMKDPQIK